MILQKKMVGLGLISIATCIVTVGCSPWKNEYGLRVTGDAGQTIEARSFLKQDDDHTVLKLKWDQVQLEKKIPGKLENLSLIHSNQSLLLIMRSNVKDEFQFLIFDIKTLEIKEKWILPEELYLPQKKVTLTIHHIEKVAWEQEGDTLALGGMSGFWDSQKKHVYRPMVIVANASTGEIRFVYIIDKHPSNIKIEENSAPTLAPVVSNLVFSSDGTLVQIYGCWRRKYPDHLELYYSAICNVMEFSKIQFFENSNSCPRNLR